MLIDDNSLLYSLENIKKLVHLILLERNIVLEACTGWVIVEKQSRTREFCGKCQSLLQPLASVV